MSSEGGFVLVVTLLVTAILVAVAVEFIYNVYISTARAGNFKGSQKASLLACNGVELAGAAIEELLKVRPNLVMDKDGLFFAKTEGDATVTIRITDELGRLSTRTVYQNGVKNDKISDEYSRLLKNLGVQEGQKLENTLADWIDSDDEPRIYGAEGVDYYGALKKPYRPRNGYLESNDEILMIKEYTPEVYGKVSPFISAYNTDGLININTAGKEVLLALSDDMTEELVKKIMDYRKETPFKDRSDIMKVPGFDKVGFNLQDKIAVRSEIFRVYSRAAAGDIVRDVEAVYRVGKGIMYWREM